MAPVERRLSGRFVDAAAEAPAPRRPGRRRHHRLLRQDLDQAPPRPAARRHPDGRRRRRRRSTTAPVSPGRSTSTWSTAPRSSSPRWAPTGPARSADVPLVPADVAVITAIGPVHLERFGSEDAHRPGQGRDHRARVASFLNVDDPRLAALADRLAGAGGGREVVRCSAVDRTPTSASPAGDGTVTVTIAGRETATGVPGRRRRAADQPGLRARGRPRARRAAEQLADRLAAVPPIPNRLTSAQAPSGVLVIDDTFNSNPAGARAGPRACSPRRRSVGRRVVVTPGMVELGPRQRPENEAFAAAAATVATDWSSSAGRTAGRCSGGRRPLASGRASGPGSGRSTGCGPISGRATPSSTRTTCPTTTLDRSRVGLPPAPAPGR